MQIPKMYAQNINKLEIDMTLSENPLGCSPLVIKALKNIKMSEISNYPNTNFLISKISKVFKVPNNSIVVGTGSEELIKLICQTFLRPNDLVLVQSNSFPLFTKESLLTKARVKQLDLNKIKTIRSKLIFLCNPNNPTGEAIDQRIINSVITKNIKSVVVVDEANIDFTKIKSLIQETRINKNLIVLRTLSKAMGLAGLRVGFAVASPKLISKLSLNQTCFPISSVAIKAALISLTDKVFLTETNKLIIKERKFLVKQIIKNGLDITNSLTNNLFIKTDNRDCIISKLNKQGVSVVSNDFYPFSNEKGFRIAIRDRKTNRKFIEKLDKAISCCV